jgi:hypothetical protein
MNTYTNAQGVPPDWYSDPYGRAIQRYWNGSAWTPYVRDASGVQGVDEGAAHPAPFGTASGGGIVIQNVVHAPQPTFPMLASGMAGYKSKSTAFWLTFLFGPLGMFYSTVSGAVIMLVVSLIVIPATLGLAFLITWPVCIIWGMNAVDTHNRQLLASMRVPQPIGCGQPAYMSPPPAAPYPGTSGYPPLPVLPVASRMVTADPVAMTPQQDRVVRLWQNLVGRVLSPGEMQSMLQRPEISALGAFDDQVLTWAGQEARNADGLMLDAWVRLAHYFARNRDAGQAGSASVETSTSASKVQSVATIDTPVTRECAGGHEMRVGDRFCPNCGSPAVADSRPKLRARASTPAPRKAPAKKVGAQPSIKRATASTPAKATAKASVAKRKAH